MSQKYTNLGSLFTDIADAIREKKGISESIVADVFPDEISNIESGDNTIEDFEEKFIKRTMQLSIYENSRVITIGNGAFYNYSSLTSVSFPQATSIGGSAFKYCSSLISISFPQVITIGSYAFQYCSLLTSASFPQVTSIGSQVFQHCSLLTSVNFPQVTSIGNSAFYNCSSLTSVSFPQVTYIGSQVFYNCSSLASVNCLQVTTIGGSAFQYCSLLTSVNFPQATSIGWSAFQSCRSLTSVNFPKVTTITNGAFQNCYSLTSVDFLQAITIGSNVFQNCYSLTSVILGGQQSQRGIIYSAAFSNCYHLTDLHLQGSYLYTLSNSNVFNLTPIGGYSASAGKYGSIYVPVSLYSQYISATNWTYFSSRFVSVAANDCGFTVSGNTLTITDNSKLSDGILNTDDYLVVGIGLDEDAYMGVYQGLQNVTEYDYSIDFRIFNNELEQNRIYNEGLSICLTDNNNNTYYCLLDESLFQYIVFAQVGSADGQNGYIPVIHKNNVYNSLTFQLKNDLNFYILGYANDLDQYYYKLVEFCLIDEIGIESAPMFIDWRENPIETIEQITNDMFAYPLQE